MRLYQRLKRQILSRVYLVRIALILMAISAGVALWSVLGRPLGSTAATLWRAASTNLPSFGGRTNFLVLGREGPSASSGPSRAGTELTDTLILVSVHHQGDTVLISVPRDLWVPSLRAKINTAYYYGEQRRPGTGGMILAKAAVEEVTGQPAHYAMVIDFAGFEKIIDILGGIDVDVEREFVDTKFPLPGRENDDCGGDPTFACRHEAVQFTKGVQHMDGATALKYVRSRQAEGEEGTDFARSKRQERLLLAVRNKLLSRAVLTQPKLLKAVYDQVVQVTITDVPAEVYPALVKLGLKAVGSPIRTLALTEPDWVYHPPVSQLQDFQWVLLPVDSLPADIKNLLAVPVKN